MARKTPVLRAIFSQIVRDENGHVAFHCDTLHQNWGAWPGLVRWGIWAAWWLIFRVACVVVMLDHYAVLRACGVSAWRFWCNCGSVFMRDTAKALTIFARRPVAPKPGSVSEM